MQPAVAGLILSAVAGMATALGGLVVFCLHDYRILPFAICMSVSAGVMLYTSFVEIFPAGAEEIRAGLSQAGYDAARAEGLGYVYVTLSFFCGWLLATILDAAVHWILHGVAKGARADPSVAWTKFDLRNVGNAASPETGIPVLEVTPHATTDRIPDMSVNPEASHRGENSRSIESKALSMSRERRQSRTLPDEPGAYPLISHLVPSAIPIRSVPSFISDVLLRDDDNCCPSCHQYLRATSHRSSMKDVSDHPRGDLELVRSAPPTSKVIRITPGVPEMEPPTAPDSCSSPRTVAPGAFANLSLPDQLNSESKMHNAHGSHLIIDASTADSVENQKSPHRNLFRKMLWRTELSEADRLAVAFAEERFKKEHGNFSRLGVVTAIALAVHNFPEGIATFVATLAQPSLGIGIAVAVGIHNIPEGFAVAVPIYFGTRSKWRGFIYSLLSGLAEPLGAVIAYAAIGEKTDHVVYGVLFGLTAGVMTNIAMKELYPAAIRYDPANRAVTLSFFVSMLVMAGTLVAFKTSSM